MNAPFRRHGIFRFCVDHKIVAHQHVRCGYHHCCKCIRPRQLAARYITHNTMLHPNCTVSQDAYSCFIVIYRQGMLRYGSSGREAMENRGGGFRLKFILVLRGFGFPIEVFRPTALDFETFQLSNLLLGSESHARKGMFT